MAFVAELGVVIACDRCGQWFQQRPLTLLTVCAALRPTGPVPSRAGEQALRHLRAGRHPKIADWRVERGIPLHFDAEVEQL